MKKVPKSKRTNLKLLVVRVNSSQILTNSMPCAVCCNFIKKSGIKKIYYSDDDGQIVRRKPDELDESHISIGVKLLKKNDMKYLKHQVYKIELEIM